MAMTACLAKSASRDRLAVGKLGGPPGGRWRWRPRPRDVLQHRYGHQAAGVRQLDGGGTRLVFEDGRGRDVLDVDRAAWCRRFAKDAPRVGHDHRLALEIVAVRARCARITAIRKLSPSRSHRLPNLAPQIRTAFSSMAPNTGSSAPGELQSRPELRMLRPAAPEPRSARPSVPARPRRRVFSMAITAWSAKVFSSSIWFSENGPASARPTTMTPIGAPFPQHWDEEAATKADRASQP